ncbi:MAG: carboxypeptidase-like regulatory domain-containing protein [Planctomycetaceae bacterium]
MNNKTHLEGQVTDEAGNPVPHAEVIAGHPYIWSGEYPSFNRETTTLTDDRGRYRLYLWPEVYSVSVFTRSAGVARVQNVKVQKNQGQTLDLSLQPGVVFKAKIADAETKAPIAGLTLYHRTRPELRGISNAEGVIEIPGALPGNEEFQIGSGIPELTRGYYKCPTEPFGSWWSPDAVKPWHRNSTTEVAIMFDLSRDMTHVGQIVQAGVVILGKVTDPDGNPVADATVAPARTGTGNSLTGDTRYSVKTQTDGNYVISLPPSGNDEYNLIAHDGVYSEWRNFAGSVSEPMHTKPGQRIEGIDMQLHRPATVRGKVSVPDGQSVKGLTVRAHAHDNRGNRYYDPTTRTDQNGEFEIGFIRPGEHYIQVEPFQMNAEDAPSESSVIVEVSEGETKDGIELHGR